MNKFKYLAYALIAAMFVSCGGDEELPFVEHDGLGYGAFARKLDGVNGVLNFFDVPNSKLDFTVEFFDEDEGRNVSSYSWTVAHPASSTGPVDLATFTASQFATNANGYPELTVEFTFQQILDALGMTIDDVTGGEFFDLQATVTKNDGSSFSSVNTGADIVASAAFAGFFQHRADIVCPSSLEGTYTATTTGTSTDGCCPDEVTLTDQEVTLTSTGKLGEYTISDWSARMYFTWYEIYGITSDFDMSATVVDACNTFSATFGEPFGTEVTLTGSVDEATGVITYSWINGYDDTATVTLTPQ